MHPLWWVSWLKETPHLCVKQRKITRGAFFFNILFSNVSLATELLFLLFQDCKLIFILKTRFCNFLQFLRATFPNSPIIQILVYLMKNSHAESCSKRWNWTQKYWKRLKLNRGPEKREPNALLTLAGISMDEAKWMLLACNQQTLLYWKSGSPLKMLTLITRWKHFLRNPPYEIQIPKVLIT